MTIRYRKLPIEIDAVRWTGANAAEVAEFAPDKWRTVDPEDRTDDPEITAEVFDELHSTWVGMRTGYWVIKGVVGEFYPCADHVFAATYEQAGTAARGGSGKRNADAALIGPLTAAEWCAFRLRLDSPDDDLLRCCAVTSEFRDALFDTLRGGAARQQAWRLEDEWAALLHHGLPEGVPQMETIRDFYGLPAAPGESAATAGDETDGSGM